MYARKQFAALEAMSREQVAVAKTEMEHSLIADSDDLARVYRF
jgi:hypothetical protein